MDFEIINPPVLDPGLPDGEFSAVFVCGLVIKDGKATLQFGNKYQYRVHCNTREGFPPAFCMSTEPLE